MAESTQKVLPSCIKLPLDPEELDEVISKAKDFALMRGICMRSKANYNPDSLQVREVGEIQGQLTKMTTWELT